MGQWHRTLKLANRTFICCWKCNQSGCGERPYWFYSNGEKADGWVPTHFPRAQGHTLRGKMERVHLGACGWVIFPPHGVVVFRALMRRLQCSDGVTRSNHSINLRLSISLLYNALCGRLPWVQYSTDSSPESGRTGCHGTRSRTHSGLYNRLLGAWVFYPGSDKKENFSYILMSFNIRVTSQKSIKQFLTKTFLTFRGNNI